MGYFRLIQKDLAGEEYQYYIPTENDSNPRIAVDLFQELLVIKSNRSGYSAYKNAQVKLELHLKKMGERMINIRIPQYSKKEAPFYSSEFMGIRVLSNLDNYSFEFGLTLENSCII
jgi:hypothetical protein